MKFQMIVLALYGGIIQYFHYRHLNNKLTTYVIDIIQIMERVQDQNFVGLYIIILKVNQMKFIHYLKQMRVLAQELDILEQNQTNYIIQFLQMKTFYTNYIYNKCPKKYQ